MTEVVRPTEKNNESAFPIVHMNAEDSWTQELGLSKRELFAAMAMQGLLSDPQMNAPHEPVAQAAVGYADALLKELAK